MGKFWPCYPSKHLTLDPGKTNLIIDQIESDSIVIVCRDVDASTIEIITQQIGWGKRVQGIVTESNLVDWYERCLRGKYSEQLAEPLMELLIDGFSAEFPQSLTLQDFMSERGYVKPSEI